MKSRSLIHLDLLIGFPLCILAFLVSLPVRPFRRREPSAPRRILVVKLMGMGSVLLATPMLRRLRRAYPEARISFLTFDTNAELVRRLEVVDDVLVVSRRGFGDLFFHLPALLLRLRRARFDLTLDLEFYSRLTSVMAWAIGARRRVGFFVRARWRGWLLTDPVYFNATLPFSRAVQALLRPLGLRLDPAIDDAATDALEVPALTDDEVTGAWRRIASQGLPSLGTYVVINVNASDLCTERRWPPDRFAQLVERFRSEVSPVETFVFIGAGTETLVVQDVLSRLSPEVRGRCLDLSGRTSLSDLILLLSRSVLLVSNDSGPLHLAAALSLPTVSFYGPETPALYGPVGDNHLVFYAGFWCSPCLSVYNAKIAMCNGENECMRRIGLDDVVTRMAVFCREEVGLVPARPPQPAGVTGSQGVAP